MNEDEIMSIASFLKYHIVVHAEASNSERKEVCRVKIRLLSLMVIAYCKF